MEFIEVTMGMRLALLFISVVAASLFLLYGYRTLVPAVQEQFGFQLTYRNVQIPAWHAAVTFLSILLGTVCGIMVELIIRSQSPADEIQLGAVFLRAATPLSLFVGAVVFIFVFPALYTAVGDIAAYVSSFQTAFLFRQFFASLFKPRRPES